MELFLIGFISGALLSALSLYAYAVWHPAWIFKMFINRIVDAFSNAIERLPERKE